MTGKGICEQIGAQESKPSVLKFGLLLTGSQSIAYILSLFLHEISHSVAAWMTDGYVGGISIHPFSWSYSYSYSTCEIFHSAAGALGVCLIGVILFLMLIRWARSWLLPLLLVGPIALLDSGSYWIGDPILNLNADASSMISNGIPMPLIFSAGLLMLMGGVLLDIVLFRKMGFFALDIKDRLLVSLIGTAPYSLCMLSWHLTYNRSEFMMWLAAVGAEMVYVVCFCLFFLRQRGIRKTRCFQINWRCVIVMNAVAVITVVSLLITAGASYARSQYEGQFQDTPPEGFRGFVQAHPDANDIGYSVIERKWSDAVVYVLSYGLPEHVRRDEITKFLADACREERYQLLRHDWFDVNNLAINDWQEIQSEETNSTSTLLKFTQTWIRMGQDISVVNLRISCTTEGDKESINLVWVPVVFPASLEKVYEYVSRYPGEFDPNQVTRVKELFVPSQRQELYEQAVPEVMEKG